MENSHIHYMEAATKSQGGLTKRLASDWNLTVDPEFKALLDEHSPEERALFEHSLLEEGCRDSIVVWKNGDKRVIVDGHHRFDFCSAHDIEFSIIEVEFEDRDAAKGWMIRNQLSRRNLPPYRRAKLALAYKPIIEAKAKENFGMRNDLPQNSAKGYTPIETRKKLAKIAGVSHDTIDKVSRIEKVAPEPIKRAAGAGEVSVNSAYELIKLEPEKIEEAATRINSGESAKEVIKEIRGKKPSNNERGWTKEDRKNRELTQKILDFTHSDEIPEYTLEMLVEDMKLDADNFFSVLRNRIAMNAELVNRDDTHMVGKMIDDYIVSGVTEIRRKVS